MSAPAQVEVRAATAHPKRNRRSMAVVLAAVLFAGGAVGSWSIASSVARRHAQASRQALTLSSAEIASTLKLAIQREQDLAVSATGFFLGTPSVSNDEFLAWADTVQGLQRYPELLGWGEVKMIPAAQLPTYMALAAADPSVVAAGGIVELVPPGERPFYCLFVVGQGRNPGTVAIPGFDYCAGAKGALALAARDSGRSGYQAVDTLNGTTTLAVQVPFYRGGVTPTTVEGRRDAFVGWVGLGFDPNIVLDQALRHRTGTAVALRFHDSTSQAAFISGQAPSGATGMTVDLENGWTVETSAVVAGAGLLANRGAVLLLLGGLMSSFAVAALVLVLGTGRALALGLVSLRTDQLRHQALHDTLTDLPNRTLIMDRIEQLLVRNRRNGTTGAALYIDLDDFKNVNDMLGHEAGDHLLVAVAERLSSALRDADTIGRMGGDEFVVLIDGAALRGAPELVGARLLDVMRQPFELDETPLPLSINTSIGIAIGDRAKGGELLRDADVALYQAKARGKNRYEIFVPEMQTKIGRRLELEFDIRSAIASDQFWLAYQPIYNLDDLTVVGVEALLRWDDPTIGAIEPEEFIPILEQTGQIQEVGRWVLRRACRQMAAWHARGHSLDVSVNVSGRQLDRDSIVDDIREALADSGLDPGSLIIEVTESAIMRNAANAAVRLRAIKQLGVRTAVDDFGTGYSSLAYLQQFPVDCLKIDRRFTNAITTSPESKTLIRTFVQLGKDLGLKTLAEGVETTEEMERLRSEHVDEAQGFLLCRPLDPLRLESEILEPSRGASETSTSHAAAGDARPPVVATVVCDVPCSCDEHSSPTAGQH